MSYYLKVHRIISPLAHKTKFLLFYRLLLAHKEVGTYLLGAYKHIMGTHVHVIVNNFDSLKRDSTTWAHTSCIEIHYRLRFIYLLYVK